MNYYRKKAAMFGLDARIALAIFGALSVITGAALYKAIGNAKAVALLNDLQEVGKAWEAYYLDTGNTCSVRGNADKLNTLYHICASSELVKNTVNISNWNGSYLNYTIAQSDTRYLEYPPYRRIYFLEMPNNNSWGEDIQWRDGDMCSSSNQCFMWVLINGIPDVSMAKQIDKIVDNSDGGKAGKFRWTEFDSELGKLGYYIQIAPIKTPI